MAVFHWQRPTHFDKHGNLTIIAMLKMHAVGHHFHVGNCRGWGQTLWSCREKKLQNFFLACWWFAKIYACKNFTLYGITLNRTIEVRTRTHFHIIPISATLQVHWSLSFWSDPNDSGMCDQTLSLMRLRLATLSLILQQLLLIQFVLCLFTLCSVCMRVQVNGHNSCYFQGRVWGEW